MANNGMADAGFGAIGTRSAPAGSNLTFENNFFSNLNGYQGLQVLGQRIFLSGNTFVNLSHSNAISVGALSGSNYSLSMSNKIYGLYNLSVGIGTMVGGQGIGNNYTQNAAYDVDSSSYLYVSMQSSDSFAGGGTLFGRNTYVSNTGSSQRVYFKGQATVIELSNGSYPVINLTAINLTGGSSYSPSYRTIHPSDFNLTLRNAYVPAFFASSSGAFNLFDFGNGTTWESAYPYDNPSFLDLTGYLGIYPSQTYTLISSCP